MNLLGYRERDEVARQRDELLVELACVGESCSAFRKMAAEAEAVASRLEVLEGGSDIRTASRLRGVVGIARDAADWWERVPELKSGLASEFADSRRAIRDCRDAIGLPASDSDEVLVKEVRRIFEEHRERGLRLDGFEQCEVCGEWFYTDEFAGVVDRWVCERCLKAEGAG